MPTPELSHDSSLTAKGTAGPDSPVGSVPISETFVSRQGEGRLTGLESFFIRFSGCNLRCWFCDTPYASWRPEGDRQSVARLIDAARQSGTRHVVLTGGEPMIFPAIVDLCTGLRESGHHVTIETAGTHDQVLTCDLMSISPKLAASGPDADRHPAWATRHEQRRLPIDVMRRVMDRGLQTQIKFVVDSPDEFAEVDRVVARLAVEKEDVLIMPQGVTPEQLDAARAWLLPWTQGRDYTYCDRMHIRWYGNRRGT